MKNDGVSANIADSDLRAMSGASEHSVTELASALAMMHATLESTTDAILVTDEANYVREFNEKYVKFWGIPPHMMLSAHASELWNYISPQLKDPSGYLARVHEIIASAAPETFDVLQLKDGRVFKRNSAIQLIKQRNVGRVWSFRDITRRKRAQDALANPQGKQNEKLDQILPDMSWHVHRTGTSNFRLFMGPMLGTTSDFMLRNQLPILAARKYTLVQH